MGRHVHADLIHQWAEGAEIENFCYWHKKWLSVNQVDPGWHDNVQYRVKPGTEPHGSWTLMLLGDATIKCFTDKENSIENLVNTHFPFDKVSDKTKDQYDMKNAKKVDYFEEWYEDWLKVSNTCGMSGKELMRIAYDAAARHCEDLRDKVSAVEPEKTTVTKWLWVHKETAEISDCLLSGTEINSYASHPKNWIKCEWSAMEFPK